MSVGSRSFRVRVGTLFVCGLVSSVVAAGCATRTGSSRIAGADRGPASGSYAFRSPASSIEVPTSLEKVLSSVNDGVNTDAVLVLKDGEVLYESYRRGYDPEKKHLSWSMAKTIAGILVAKAIDSRWIGLDDPISIYLPETKSTARIRDVLQMSSGIAFREEYSGVPVNSDATRMLYLVGPKTGFGAFTANLPLRKDDAPGEHFYYSSGDTNVLMEILRRRDPQVGNHAEFPFRAFFSPLGIEDVAFERDSYGTFVGSSYVYLTLRDYARVGTLLMNAGVGPNGRVIPEWYFDLMTEVAPGVQKKALAGTSPNRAYSMQITTNRPITGRSLPSQHPDLPTDAILMIGHQGQLVVASPSQKLVIVRLAMDKGTALDRPAFFRSVVELVRANEKTIVTARDERPEDYVSPPVLPTDDGGEPAKFGEYFQVPKLIRALAAKEYCSCIHLTGRTDEQCKADLKVSLPVLPKLTVDPKTKAVRAVLGTGIAGKASRAEYRGPRLGCTLTISE